jgi:hypothetical protein
MIQRLAQSLLLALFITLVVPLSADSQVLPQERIGAVQTNAAYFLYARPGALTHKVYVLGDVRTGIYEVGHGTTLAELFTLASGSTIQERTQYDRSTITVRLYRPSETGRQLVQETELEDLLTQQRYNLELQDGDVLAVETLRRQRFSWRDGLSIATGLAAVSLAIDRILAN